MNSREHWVQAEELFAALVDLAPGDRAAALAAYQGPEAVREEVASLLAAHDAPQVRLAPATGSAPLGAHLLAAPLRLIGQRLGPWLVTREIGSGGMGVVYEAVRADDDLAKRVAIKTIGRGVDSEVMVQRFRQEERILARLEHPNIAMLLDAGVTEMGLPYFVMEFVDGLPIDRYCRDHTLTLAQRLDLFRQVCAAVQFAHRNLVVHRDLKPSNVMVSPDGVVKLVDFGIAKLLADDPGDQVRTATGFRAFTAAYASPEQVRGQPVSTASDVYSLGVILYLLLAGRLPFDAGELTPTGAIRAVTDSMPDPPSRVCTREAAEGMGFAHANQLARALAPELDDIVRMAVRKEPERRYPTVAALADDLKRFLQGQQVMARPDTVGYRVRSFVRRNRGLAVATGVAIASLVLGTVVASWQAASARVERDRAQQASAQSERVVEYLEGILSAPSQGEMTSAVMALLEQSVARATTELADDPLARAAVYRTASHAFVTHYLSDRAQPLIDSALALDRAHAGPSAAVVGRDLQTLARIAYIRGEYLAAVEHSRAAVAILRRDPGDRPEDLPRALQYLGVALTYAGLPAEGIAPLEEAIEMETGRAGSLVLAYATASLAEALATLGRGAEAEAAVTRSLAAFDSLPVPDIAERGIAELIGANVLGMLGKLGPADSLARSGLGILERRWGRDHIYAGLAWAAVARTSRQRGDFVAALAQVETALRILAGKPISGLERVSIRQAHGWILADLGRLAEAEAVLRETLAQVRAQFGANAMLLGPANWSLGDLLLNQGRMDEAEPLLLEAHRQFRAQGSGGEAAAAFAAGRIAFLYQVQGDSIRAAPFLSQLPSAQAESVRAQARRWIWP